MGIFQFSHLHMSSSIFAGTQRKLETDKVTLSLSEFQESGDEQCLFSYLQVAEKKKELSKPPRHGPTTMNKSGK